MPSVILKDMQTKWISERPWTSPDGKVTIWTIKLEDPTGERGDYSTMSKTIATMDWKGDIELYTNDKGKEYVRQAPKEDSFSGGSTDYAKNGEAISASMAVKLAYTQFCHVETMLPKDEEMWDVIQYNAEMIYKIINRVKGTADVKTTEPVPEYQGD